MYSRANSGQTEQTITAAREAFKTWQNSTPQQRFEVLDFVSSEILTCKEELGRLLSLEEGKVLTESFAEVTRAGQIFKYFTGEALRIEGGSIPSVRPEVNSEATREPLGVAGIITPWIFRLPYPSGR